MSFGSDIHVFICMGFVLVELFDGWAYGFYNGCYLRLIMVEIKGFELYHVIVNLIFPLLLGLFGAS